MTDVKETAERISTERLEDILAYLRVGRIEHPKETHTSVKIDDLRSIVTELLASRHADAPEGGEPSWFAVQSVTGSHIGMWQDEKIARRVFNEEYPDGRFIPLYAAPSNPVVSDEAANYLVWSNEHRAWWRANSCGYARSILEAGRYTRADAVDIADKSRNGWQADQRPDEIAVAIADLPPSIRTALSVKPQIGSDKP